MNENLTEIVCILDKSGSMEAIISDAIGGFNAFLKKQQLEKGECKMTVVQFDHRYKVLHDAVDIGHIDELNNLTYQPDGTTALLDAIGKSINRTGNRLANTPETKRPGKVIFFIMTDGMENSSREFSYNQIKEMIGHQSEHYSWSFIFASSDISGANEAMNIGIPNANFMQFSKTGKSQHKAYNIVSDSVSRLRNMDPEIFKKAKDKVLKDDERDAS